MAAQQINMAFARAANLFSLDFPFEVTARRDT
jgi:hypothetical protein